MRNVIASGSAGGALAREWLGAARHYLGTRRVLLLIGAAVLVLAIAVNWSWLIAAGIAPILLAALPCAVMCGLGLCMGKLFGSSRETQAPASQSMNKPAGNTSALTNVSARAEHSSSPLPGCCHGPTREAPPANLNQSQVVNERRSSDA